MRKQFRSNVKIFKKKKVLSFLFKINGSALLDAGIVTIIIGITHSHSVDGIIMDDESIHHFMLLAIISMELMKVVISSGISVVGNIIVVFSYLLMAIVLLLVSTD